MKNKTLKKTLLISTGLLAAGGICIGIGIAMGGSPVFYLDNEGIHLKETTAARRRYRIMPDRSSWQRLKKLRWI